ncbi:MAG: hypothetical protein APR54_12940 [Candidatus Cloacimonas sp. SDB]|nr:MAG: hypothetical protein APR54_12940 [Candidatus Cloacimonas sp. SDB]
MKNQILLFFLFSILFIQYSLLNCIEVGGHLTENTIWNPENNPYLVTENLYVDAGITLTIEPGTIVKICAAPLTNYNDNNENFWLYNGDSVAKMIWVDGRIIAEGTEQDSIIFDRIQDDVNYNWGSIYMTDNADMSIFKHCLVQNAAGIWVAVSVPTKGLCFENGIGIVKKCTFINNAVSIHSVSYSQELEISDNRFVINEFVNPFYPSYNYGKKFIISGCYDDPSQRTLICNNIFMGIETYACISSTYISFFNNLVTNCYQSKGIGHFYKNEFINCEVGITANGESDSLYIKNNRFIGGDEGVDIDYAYVEISDNYFEGCGIFSTFASGVVNNNIMDASRMWVAGDLEVFNNVAYNSSDYGIEAGYNPYCSNNISINNGYAIWSATNTYENSIIILNEELSQYPINGIPIFRNCIIDFPLDPPLIDGGGNIIVDSLQAQSIFEDIQNGDFHLAPGSIAIDAGFDTLGYYYPFDIEYSKRVWDGDGDGSDIIDIGPYEYGAPELGKITGNITETTSGEPVDYVLLKIDNEPGNFTFADSSGYFEIQLPSGTYDIYAERVFYEDNIVYSVTVEDEQITQINFNMTCTLPQVSIKDELITNSSFQISNLLNYPNPFNPETTIEFSIKNNSKVNLTIFNIKGQSIKTLIDEHLPKGDHSIIWSGYNQNGNQVTSGIYLYKLEVGNQNSVKRMLLLK